MKGSTKNEHRSAFKKLGLVSTEHRYSCTWDYSYNTFANVFTLAPKEKPLMLDLNKYINKQKYVQKALNTALVLEVGGKEAKIRCYYFHRRKFDFIVVNTRQTKGKKEYVTRVAHHYTQAKAPEPIKTVAKPAEVKTRTRIKSKSKQPSPTPAPRRRLARRGKK